MELADKILYKTYGSKRVIETEENHQFKVNANIIKKRSYLGQKVFVEQPALHLDRIENVNKLTLYVKKCGYNSIASRMIRLENEVYKKVYSPIRKYAAHYRNRYFNNLSAVFEKKPIAIGCTAVLAFKTTNNDYEILLHERSHNTVTWGGAITLLPNFGLCPLVNNEEQDIGLLYNNFLREFLEELFNYEEMIDIGSQKRLNSTWFYELPEAKKLLESNDFSLIASGAWFNALNGVCNIALLGKLDDRDLACDLKKKIIGNWEIERPGINKRAIEFVNVNSYKLTYYLKDKIYNPATAFAISRALPLLR